MYGYHHSQKARGPPQEAGGGGYLRDFQQIGASDEGKSCEEIGLKKGLQRNQEISG